MRVRLIACSLLLMVFADGCTVHEHAGTGVFYAYSPPVVYERVEVAPAPRVVVVHHYDGYIAYDWRYMRCPQRGYYTSQHRSRHPAHARPSKNNYWCQWARPTTHGCDNRLCYSIQPAHGGYTAVLAQNNNQKHKRGDQRKHNPYRR